jgi:hypothetical protein
MPTGNPFLIGPSSSMHSISGGKISSERFVFKVYVLYVFLLITRPRGCLELSLSKLVSVVCRGLTGRRSQNIDHVISVAQCLRDRATKIFGS